MVFVITSYISCCLFTDSHIVHSRYIEIEGTLNFVIKRIVLVMRAVGQSIHFDITRVDWLVVVFFP